MSPQAGWILQEEIVPRLRSAIPRNVFTFPRQKDPTPCISFDYRFVPGSSALRFALLVPFGAALNQYHPLVLQIRGPGNHRQCDRNVSWKKF